MDEFLIYLERRKGASTTMREVTVRLYQFDELTDEAKEKARDWWREASIEDEPRMVLEDADHFAALLGITIKRNKWQTTNGKHEGTEPAIYYALHVQGAGACFEGTYEYQRGSVAKIKAEAPEDTELQEVARQLYEVQRRNFYSLSAKVTHSGHSVHERSADIGVYDYRTGDFAVDDEAEDVAHALMDFMHWIYERLVAEYEYTSSEEYIDEALRANEYEFTEDGRRA